MKPGRNRRNARNRNRRRRYGGRKKKPAHDPKPPIPNRLQDLRERVWGAMGVASCVEYASDSMLAVTASKPDVQQAMAALFDILGEVSGPLEDIIEELGGVVEEGAGE